MLMSVCTLLIDIPYFVSRKDASLSLKCLENFLRTFQLLVCTLVVLCLFMTHSKAADEAGDTATAP